MSRFYQKIGSLLGLLAILMTTLAPTISHTLAANRDSAVIPQAYCGVPSTQYVAPDDNAGQHHHPLISDGQDCGYCGLLAHMPVIPSVTALFAVTVRAVQHRVATRFESVRRVESLTSAQPRAPPVLS
ncbi:DUF2946 domain-containing protein [Paraburkholderia sartisoli]|uniref:DUF2946 domain-containing protein n=1 Tax=Paraburkholderia sartisoli TaxID=83784 RepID=UPI000B862665|nr:DUF2946 domain-containing protein [Paraburkholderia sartisoli]